MKRLYDFQTFDKTFFDKLEMLVVRTKDKEDRKTVTVIILEDNNTYKTGEVGLNRFEKIYINITNENFEQLKFEEGESFDMKQMNENSRVSIWGDFGKQLSVTGEYIGN